MLVFEKEKIALLQLGVRAQPRLRGLKPPLARSKLRKNITSFNF